MLEGISSQKQKPKTQVEQLLPANQVEQPIEVMRLADLPLCLDLEKVVLACYV